MKEKQDIPNLLYLPSTMTVNNMIHKRNCTEEGAVELRTLSMKEKGIGKKNCPCHYKTTVKIRQYELKLSC